MVTHGTIRLLHLSDIHFGGDHCFSASPKPGMPSLSRDLHGTLLTHIRKLDHFPDVVIVSGDLTSAAQRTEFHEASQFISSLTNDLGLPDGRLVVVPGNHDIFWGRGESRSSGEYESFASRMFHVPVDQLDVRTLQFGGVYIMGLDLTRVESPNRRGIGFAGHDQLDKASEQLKRDRCKAIIRILVVHHHLLPVAFLERFPDDYPPSFTADAPRIIAWAQENGFAAILHGHQHHAFLSTIHLSDRPGGPLIISGAPSAGSKDLPAHGANGYQTVVIDNNRLTFTVYTLSESGEYKEDRSVSYIQEATGVFAITALPYTRSSHEPTLPEIRAVCKVAMEHLMGVMQHTYGPKGGLRGIVSTGSSAQARDGQHVVQSLITADILESRITGSIATMINEVTQRLGDGRKTAAIICAATITAALDGLEKGVSDYDLCHGIESASRVAHDSIAKQSADITSREEIVRVATAAACGNSDIGEALASSMERVGKDGVIQIEKTAPDEGGNLLEIWEDDAFALDCTSPDWLQRPAPEGVTWQNPLFFVASHSLDLVEIVPLMEAAADMGQPLIILCERVTEVAEDVIAENVRQGRLNCVAIPATGGKFRWNESYRDVAALTGARFIESHPHFSARTFTAEMFGHAESVTLGEGKLTIRGGAGKGEKLTAHIESLRTAESTAESEYDKERIRGRMARLLGLWITIHVRGKSVADMELMHGLVADALRAACSAVRKGIVSGGGAAYYRASNAVREQIKLQSADAAGAAAFVIGLEAPVRALLQQIDGNPDGILGQLDSEWATFDVIARTCVRDIKAGPLDSAEIAMAAIRLAADTAVRVLRTRSWEAALEPEE